MSKYMCENFTFSMLYCIPSGQGIHFIGKAWRWYLADHRDLFETGRPAFYNRGFTQSWPHPPGVAMVTGGGKGSSAGGHKGEERSYTTLSRIKWLASHLWTGEKQSIASNENESKTLCTHFNISLYSFPLHVKLH